MKKLSRSGREQMAGKHVGRGTLARRLVISHTLFFSLLAVICLAPKARPGLSQNLPLITAVLLIEGAHLFSVWRSCRGRGSQTAPFDIVSLVWLVLLFWELFTSVLHKAHPVLIPAPENVFYTFFDQWDKLLLNIWYSLQLLLTGFFIGLIAAVILGMFAGWYPRLQAFAYPIANIMAPIPAIVISPYLVSLMPSFRSASVLVIILGIFWPTFLNTVNRVVGMEPQILDSARMLHLGNSAMIWQVLLPYLFPGIVGGLKVSMTTSLLMLNFAELMGATHGMGYYVQNSITYANYAHAIAGIIVIGIVVTALNALVTRLQKSLIRWH